MRLGRRKDKSRETRVPRVAGYIWRAHDVLMAGYKKDAPAEFAQLVAHAIRDQMSARDMSGRALARRIGMSEKYIRERLALKFEFSLNDVQQFCAHIGVDPVDFIAALDRDALGRDGADPRARSDDELDVSGLSEDELRSRYALAANRDESADRLDPDTQ